MQPKKAASARRAGPGGYGGQKPPGLVAVDDRSRVNGLERAGPGPLDGLERIGRQRVDLDCVLGYLRWGNPYGQAARPSCPGTR